MDEFRWQKRIRRELSMRETARGILGVSEDASPEEVKRAWREACKTHHPDRNSGDTEAGRRFAASNCAYRLLAYGEPCGELPDLPQDQPDAMEHERYRLDNAWGLFLWWRDRFF